MTNLKHLCRDILLYILACVSPRSHVALRYRLYKGKWMDWKCPYDINEKIQWIKFYGDTDQWSKLADKYAVRDFIKEKGFEEMLIPLIGKWEKAEEIDWDSLPNQFVMKTNHGSGDALICTNKNEIDTEYWTMRFSKLLRQKFGKQMGEPHYDNINPCIIVEKLMDCTKQQFKSTSLIDYKVWAFNGKSAYIWVCYNRSKSSCEVAVYDLNWNFHPEFSRSEPHYILADKLIPRPKSLEKMLEVASVLSRGFPVIRIDFYEVDGKPYFGEMTFTPASGLNSFYSQEFLDILGNLCVLPKRSFK